MNTRYTKDQHTVIHNIVNTRYTKDQHTDQHTDQKKGIR